MERKVSMDGKASVIKDTEDVLAEVEEAQNKNENTEVSNVTQEEDGVR